ncbi:hypothetical protein A3K01_02135 [candidate division WWE3 bacterium RIFOXYD1_FULL_43_17]|uniref:Uncharacterized protein n=1 Tax=candidate division WWE3 bacterium RIFOXYD1_FULL_43_17 TaxID=1802652 RepID=A0A1F4XE38_UNCKA|nr:MAG: hypothetical protein A3K01_02135 [candidate division WWE3 bacterium RIFOXYD1_FULL_43_17]
MGVRAGIVEIQVRDAFGQETKQEGVLAPDNARLILCVTTLQLAIPALPAIVPQPREMVVIGTVWLVG